MLHTMSPDAFDTKASGKTKGNRFQVMTMPLKQKDLDLFFSPRVRQGSAVNSDEDAVSSSVASDVEVQEAAVEEAIVETAGTVEVGEAVGAIVETEEAVGGEEVIDEVVEEVVAPVEAVKTKLPKRIRAPDVPCHCTVPGSCYGQQYSSKAALDVHTRTKHGDPTKADEKRSRDNVLRNTNRKRRRKEDPEWREHERALSAANRYK